MLVFKYTFQQGKPVKISLNYFDFWETPPPLFFFLIKKPLYYAHLLFERINRMQPEIKDTLKLHHLPSLYLSRNLTAQGREQL